VKTPQASFWRGKRVLVTGHSGFKGSWLVMWLRHLGADVVGISLPPDTEPNLFTLARISDSCQSHFCDIRRGDELAALIKSAQPQLVFHMAALPLVRASYRFPLETFDTNVMGTANVLDALRGLESPQVAVMVTTDKVYRNIEKPRPYQESDKLGGADPYSASKAASEMVISAYRDSYLREQGVAVAAARAGNVIGGGDWSEDRLIPDAIRAWQANQELDIRHPQAVRPWQHVIEPLAGYLSLAQQLWHDPSLAEEYNFGPQVDSAVSVREVVELARGHFPTAAVNYASSSQGPHEAGLLVLDTEKARLKLGVSPRWSLAAAIGKTVDWYRQQHGGVDARALCMADISAFEAGE
jgi:CDP-glucose 4,6-dehydratase